MEASSRAARGGHSNPTHGAVRVVLVCRLLLLALLFTLCGGCISFAAADSTGLALRHAAAVVSTLRRLRRVGVGLHSEWLRGGHATHAADGGAQASQHGFEMKTVITTTDARPLRPALLTASPRIVGAGSAGAAAAS